MEDTTFQPNNTKNVSVGKGVQKGYLFAAPLGSPLPTRYDTIATDLGPDYENLGYINEDGFNNAIEADSEDYVDMNGDTVESAGSSYKETFVFSLLEQKLAALRQEYGFDNVTDENGQIVARHNSNSKTPMQYVALIVLKDGRRQTTVIPNGQVTEVGEKQYNSQNLLTREITVTCYPDDRIDGDCIRDYIESTETKTFNKSIEPSAPTNETYKQRNGSLDKNLDDLVGPNYRVTREGDTIKATGTVYTVAAWDSAYGKKDQGDAYPVFHIEAPAGSKIKTQTLSGTEKTIELPHGTEDIVCAIKQANPKREFSVESADGNETVKITFDVSACTFEAKEN